MSHMKHCQVTADLNRYLADCDEYEAYANAVEKKLEELQKEYVLTITDTADGSAYPWTWRFTAHTGMVAEKVVQEDGAETREIAEKDAANYLESVAKDMVKDAEKDSIINAEMNRREYPQG